MRSRRVAPLAALVIALPIAMLVNAGGGLASTGPSTPLLDDFNRADNGGPPSASWSHQPVGSTGSSNDLKVASNQATGNSSGSNTDYWNPQAFGPDAEAYVTIAVKPTADLDTVALGLREQNPASSSMNGYQAYYYNRSSTDQYEIGKRTNGSYTTLGTRVSGPELSAGNKLWFRAVGSTLELYRFNGTTWSLIVSRTDSTYSGSGNISLTARNTVVRLDDFGGGTVTSNSPPVNTSPPTISGSAQQGQTLTATQGTWTGSPTPTLTDQWRRCDTAGANCADIAGAAGLSYVLTAGDVGFTIRVLETGTNTSGSASASSAATPVVTAGGGGSGGSGLATGLSADLSLSESLVDVNSNPVSGAATLYFDAYKPSTLSGSGPWPLIVELPGSPPTGGCTGTQPNGYSKGLADCVMNASGCGTSCSDLIHNAGWIREADTDRFLFAMAFAGWKKSAGNCGSSCNTHSYGGDYHIDACNTGSPPQCIATDFFDTNQFILDVVEYMKSHANVDTTKIYLVGDSAGGNHLERIVCNSTTWDTSGGTHFYSVPNATLLNQLAGVGFWSGGLSSLVPNSAPITSGSGAPVCLPSLASHQLSLIHVHGTSDNAVPYNSTCTGTPGTLCTIGQANEKTYWVGQMSCSQTPTTGPTTVNGLGSHTITTTTYSTSCTGGKTYETVFVNGAGHDGALWQACATTCVGDLDVPATLYSYLSTH